jgi:hypothetical protein
MGGFQNGEPVKSYTPYEVRGNRCWHRFMQWRHLAQRRTYRPLGRLGEFLGRPRYRGNHWSGARSAHRGALRQDKAADKSRIADALFRAHDAVFLQRIRRQGRRQAGTAAARADNTRVALAREAYAAAQKAMEAECVKRGPRCRAAEEAVTKARESLSAKPAEHVEDSGAARIAAIFPSLTTADVTLYQPLILPFSLQIGGFVMLAFGLSPRRREPEPKVAKRKRRKKAPTKPAKSNADYQRAWREHQKAKLSVVK